MEWPKLKNIIILILLLLNGFLLVLVGMRYTESVQYERAALEQTLKVLEGQGIQADGAALAPAGELAPLTAERDLRETFRRVRRWLKPGGLFLFDVNTPCKLRRMDGQLYMDETEESCCVWRTFFSEKKQICTYQVDLFRLRPDGAWDRSFEEHRERAWSEEELQTCLRGAGFSSVKLTGDLTDRPPKLEEDRWQLEAK